MVKELSNIIFLWPYAFLLLPLPLIVARFSSTLQWSIPTLRFSLTERIAKHYKNHLPATIRSSRSFMSVLPWALLVIAIARPVTIDKNITILQDGYDIILAVDLSSSMSALDYSNKKQTINRLEAVRGVLANHFVTKRPGDRIGMVVFAEEAFLYSPLTFNHKAIEQMLTDMRIGMAGESTAIGDAIAISTSALQNSTSKNKIIILLTDGVDNASSIKPIQAARISKNNSIRIYTIGIGKNGLVPIPLDSGQIIMGQMPIDEETLSEIANITQGIYARAKTLKELEAIYKHINELEKSPAFNDTFVSYTSLHYWPLSLFLFLIMFNLISKTHVQFFRNSFSKL